MSGCDIDKVEHSLTAEVDPQHVTIHWDSGLLMTLKMNEYADIMKKYNANYGRGLPYYQRELFEKISLANRTRTLDNIIRAFAVSNAYLDLATNWDNYDFWCKTLHDTVLKFFSGTSLIDWTGDMGIQPTMYFIKRDTVEQEKPGIDVLYQIGMVQRYRCRIEGYDEIVSHYVPFDLPVIDNISLLPHRMTWNKIIREMNTKLDELNKKTTP